MRKYLLRPRSPAVLIPKACCSSWASPSLAPASAAAWPERCCEHHCGFRHPTVTEMYTSLPMTISVISA